MPQRARTVSSLGLYMSGRAVLSQVCLVVFCSRPICRLKRVCVCVSWLPVDAIFALICSRIVSDNSQTDLRHVSTGLRHVSDTSQTHLRHVSDTSQTRLRQISDTSQTHLRHVSDTSQTDLRQISDTSQTRLRQTSDGSRR